jgi:CRP/FNR family transcriptional regulator, cyclic AMP receptor protein
MLSPRLRVIGGLTETSRHAGGPRALAGLPRQCATKLLQGAQSLSLEEGDIVVEGGARIDGCYWLEDGVLKASIASHRGEERIIELLGPGSIVGALSVIDGLPQSATVQTLTDCRLTFVSRSAFLECQRDYPELQTHLVTAIAAHLRHATDETTAASILPARPRVARALLQFARYFGEATGDPGQILIRRKFRQNDVAALAHVARENASRIFNGWRKRKVIEYQSALVYVIHKQRLEREAHLSE